MSVRELETQTVRTEGLAGLIERVETEAYTSSFSSVTALLIGDRTITSVFLVEAAVSCV